MQYVNNNFIIQWNPSGEARNVSLKLQNLVHFHAPFFTNHIYFTPHDRPPLLKGPHLEWPLLRGSTVIPMDRCKKDVTPVRKQWSYVFLALLTHWYMLPVIDYTHCSQLLPELVACSWSDSQCSPPACTDICGTADGQSAPGSAVHAGKRGRDVNIEARTKWLIFCRQHFKMHFINRILLYLVKISLKFVPKGWIENKSALVQVMASC